ncbi:MAG: choice-of-anchor tandem repeat GloVer-containing protein [Terriglobales bacterium]
MKYLIGALWIVVCLALMAEVPFCSAQTYSVLYSFKAGPHGTYPGAGVTVDAKRQALYGTTENDGRFAAGAVFALDLHGQRVLHSFSGNPGDGAHPFGNGSPLLANGALFSATQGGGIYDGTCETHGCGVVFKIDQFGTETVLYQFTGGTDGWGPEGTLASDPSGNVYGVTRAGGNFNAGAIFKLDSSGHETVLHSFAYNSPDGASPLGGVLRDNHGNLYGTTYLGGTWDGGTIFKVDTSGNLSIVYNFGDKTGDAGNPDGRMTPDGKGNLYGIASAGGILGLGAVFKVSSTGTETVLHSFGAIPDAQTPIFNGVALDPSGVLYGVTHHGGAFGLGAIFKIDAAGNETVIHSFSGPDGEYPYGGLARDPQGSLYGTTSQGGAYGGGVIFRIKP